ncbi:hypothetical protein DFH09DRAFT_1157223 [Mycena vulgaris]|nr:hypothetical protein DFH09DRAFT_1157223 [Mycena vulgaris]
MPESCWKCGAPPCAPALTQAPPAADLTRLLTSNDPPEASDIPSVLHGISNCQARIDALDAQMESQRSTLEQLFDERDEAAECLRQHQAILSPARHIFLRTLPWERRVNDTILGHAALAYPALWRFLIIGHSAKAPAPDRYPLAMLETTLIRSANAPLDVTFGYWDRAQADAYICDPLWLDLLVRDTNRWTTIRIPRYNDSRILIDILGGVRGKLPALKRLEFGGYTYSQRPVQEIADYFLVAPSLRQVILTDNGLPAGAEFQESSYHLTIPWNKITHYRGLYTPVEQFQILRQAPNLVECEIGFLLAGNPPSLGRREVITLPSLRRLRSSYSKILDHLQLPSLEALCLQNNASPLLSFLHRSSCPLTKLVLMSCDIPAEFTPILRCIPTLTYLFLECTARSVEDTTPLLEAMTLSGSPSDLCLNLTFFAFARWATFDPSEDTLIAMLRSRLDPNLPVRLSVLRLFHHIRVWQDTTAPSTLLARLQTFSDDGLNVAFLSDRRDVEELRRMDKV